MIFNESIYNKSWNIKKLNELGTFTRGKSKHRPRNDFRLFENGNYPFIQTGDIKNAILYVTSHTKNYNDFGLKQSKLWKAGTLCITIAANIADTAILSYPMCFPDSIVGFVADIKESSEIFMHYIFIYIQKYIQNSVTGSIQDNINIDYLQNLEFRIPLKEHQDKIALILSSIDKKIELNNKINSELENMAKTIYDYWFLQFEFPNKEGKPYKSSGGKMIWNEELKKEIPNGWEVTQIDSVLSAVPSTRKKLKKEYLSRGKHPVIDQSSVYISGFTDDEKAVLFLKDAVVFGDHTKIIKYINFDFCRGADGTQILLSNRENLPNILLYHQVKNLNLVSQGYSRYFKFLKEKQIVLPNFEIAKQFKITSEKLYQKIRSNIFENQELTSLRDYLLPLLMNGQVGFKD